MKAKTLSNQRTQLKKADTALDVLRNQKAQLQIKLQRAIRDEETAEAKKEAFIEKYGEDAWDANIGNYSDGYGTNLSRYAQRHGRYPGFAIWNGEGPIMRKINDVVGRRYALIEEIENIDKKIKDTEKTGALTNVKSYYGEWETSKSKREDDMMSALWGEIDIFVNTIGYDYIRDKAHPGYGQYLRETTLEHLVDEFHDITNRSLTREQVEEVATDVWNTVYLGGYKDDDGVWHYQKS